MGVFSRRINYAVVIPLHEKCDVSRMAKYRPIPLLPVFLKFFEKASCCKLYKHLRTNSTLPTE